MTDRDTAHDDWFDELNAPVMVGPSTYSASHALFELSPTDYQISVGQYHEGQCGDNLHEFSSGSCDWCGEDEPPTDEETVKDVVIQTLKSANSWNTGWLIHERFAATMIGGIQGLIGAVDREMSGYDWWKVYVQLRGLLFIALDARVLEDLRTAAEAVDDFLEENL